MVLPDGRELSNKPPLMAFAGAALYAPLHAVTGWRLADPRTGGRAIWTLTVLLVGVPAAATVALFARAVARDRASGPRTRSLLVVALGAGTLVASFSGTLNNHVPAALGVLAGVLAALDGRFGRAGLWLGLAAAIDLLPGAGFVPVAFALLLAAPDRVRALARFAGGLAVAATLFVAANVATAGSPLPPKMLPGAVDLSAQAGPAMAGVVLPQGPFYALELLFGGHGLFSVSPVLLVGAAGLALAVRRPPFGPRRFWTWLAAGIVLQFVGHALVAGSYGGWSYGYRYLIPIQPLLLLAAPAALAARAGRLALAALLPPSLVFAALGAFHPWPPAFEQSTAGDPVATLVTNPIGGNAAAWLERNLPGSAAARAAGEVFVDRDPELRRRYYRLFFGSKGDLATLRRFER
ncbi:MAG: hypothetical protein AMXMBFR36_11820 [Acidobacteriota bacterium]